ncbi:hypothetical protein SDRG_08247 [Saprolegnia diclina VS20]|uniref:B30.2/SPRY domain-containing protein n=1 Tax=Saprolegnia diclina (strain VS20) TaxID=1156394 RepID=T0RNT4_SAPDV|nr:hypothetical protein SDRG_08247 [Saprolegnia diclina VS20]EQC34033.1 hypothetical protein SDRG_08247 [Saprolegnia diclina VS20]|eukprot:XP_008612345.1 hypothetical protein SDRG_08247 [Saprolegnia diclina VS20]
MTDKIGGDFAFDATAHGNELQVTQDDAGSTVACVAASDGRCHMAVAATPFGPVWAVHFEILASHEGIAIGVVSGQIRKGVGLGKVRDCDGHGWGLASNGDLWHAGDVVATHMAFEAHDILSVALDLNSSGPAGPGTLVFYRHRHYAETIIVQAFSGVRAYYERACDALYPAVHLQHAGEAVRSIVGADIVLPPVHELHGVHDVRIKIPSAVTRASLPHLWNASRAVDQHDTLISLLPSLLELLPTADDDGFDHVLAVLCNLLHRTSTPPLLPSPSITALYDRIPQQTSSTTLPWVLLALEPQHPPSIHVVPSLWTALASALSPYAQQAYVALLLRLALRLSIDEMMLPQELHPPVYPHLQAAWVWLVHRVASVAPTDAPLVRAFRTFDPSWLQAALLAETARLPHVAVRTALAAIQRQACDDLQRVGQCDVESPVPPARPYTPARAMWLECTELLYCRDARGLVASYARAMAELRSVLLFQRRLLDEVASRRRQWVLPNDETPVVYAEAPIIARLLHAAPRLLVPILEHAGYLGAAPHRPKAHVQSMAHVLVCSLLRQHALPNAVADLVTRSGSDSILSRALLDAFLATVDMTFWRYELRPIINWFLTTAHAGTDDDDVLLEYVACSLALRMAKALEQDNCPAGVRALLVALSTSDAVVNVVLQWVQLWIDAPEWWCRPTEYTPVQTARAQSLLSHVVTSGHLRLALLDADLPSHLLVATRSDDASVGDQEEALTFCALYGVEIVQLLNAATSALMTWVPTTQVDTARREELQRLLQSPMDDGPSIEVIVSANPLMMTLVASQSVPLVLPRFSRPIEAMLTKVLALLQSPAWTTLVTATISTLPSSSPASLLWEKLLAVCPDGALRGHLCDLIDTSRLADTSIDAFVRGLHAVATFQASQRTYMASATVAASVVTAQLRPANDVLSVRLWESRFYHFVRLPMIEAIAREARATLKATELAVCHCRFGLNTLSQCHGCEIKWSSFETSVAGSWLHVQLQLSHSLNAAFRVLLTSHQTLVKYFVPDALATDSSTTHPTTSVFSLVQMAPRHLPPMAAAGWHDHVLLDRLHAAESPTWRDCLFLAALLPSRPLLCPSVVQDAALYDQLVLLERLVPSDVGLVDDAVAVRYWTLQLQRATMPTLLPETARRRLRAFVRHVPPHLLAFCVAKARPRSLFSVVRNCYIWVTLHASSVSFASFLATEGWHPLLLAGLRTFSEKGGEWAVRMHERLQRHTLARSLLDETLRVCPLQRLCAVLDISAAFEDRLVLADQGHVAVQSALLSAPVPWLELVLHCEGDPMLVQHLLDGDVAALRDTELRQLLRVVPTIGGRFLWLLVKPLVMELVRRESSVAPGIRCVLRHLTCIERLGYASGFDVATTDDETLSGDLQRLQIKHDATSYTDH